MYCVLERILAAKISLKFKLTMKRKRGLIFKIEEESIIRRKK